MSERWVVAFPSEALERGEARVFRDPELARRQVAVFRLDDGALHAVDNRCPHEGYPLAKGHVRECVLTCAWHNFKFDLSDGRCLVGDEDVRRYPVRDRDGKIELELSDPPPGADRPARWASLERGLLDGRTGQVARDLVRLLAGGVTPLEVALRAAALDARYAEYGTTHATPVAIDVLRFCKGDDASAFALPLMQAFDFIADAHARRPPRPTPAASGDGSTLEARLPGLVENERVEEAEALLRAALEGDVALAAVEAALYEVCAQHFLDFGHALIYQVKLFELLDRLGEAGQDIRAAALDLLPAHLVGMVYGTREDTLPDFESYAERMTQLEPRFASLLARQSDAQLAAWDRSGFETKILEGRGEDAFDAIADALEIAVPIPRILDALSVCAAERMLRFDAGHELDPTVQEGWLATTHGLTYVAALRQAHGRCPPASFLRLLFFAGRFLNRTRTLDAEQTLPAPAECPDLETLLSTVLSGELDEAMAQGQGYLRDGGDPERLLRGLAALALDDLCVRPIRVAHLIKTPLAAADELRALGDDPERERLPLAVLRFAASPMRERGVGRLVHEAVRFVRDGKVPRSLI